ncbi:Disintegrin and metalloproteinase domain-containing protein B [Cytospora mali]|uniref:Disintegrin and metalloproteinase domain-containing protein B n=1 Tax=Cytospora mali TaxID=578113 RepID=A0A194V1H7_CYTMA|nr:Disintegrin and metalloproteinase domain-containing protein B [Valsa mali var. pyri (nom. inval.)]
MKFLGKIAFAVTGLLQLLPAVIADSRQRNPLSHVGQIDKPRFQTPSHRVHAYSQFQVTFSLSDARQTIRLSLEPNHDVVADGATITYLGQDGTIQRSEPIDRLDHRVFRGDAFVQDEGDTEWTNAGWARIHVHRDGPNPLFEGAFQLYGDYHHIQTSNNYRKTRLRDDPDIEERSDEYMVLWRDSDIKGNHELGYSPSELKRALAEKETCTSDELVYNVDENHPVYRGIDKRSSWSSEAGNLLFGRQIDGTTGGNSAGVNLSSTIGSTTGCPTARKVALIGIATDCTYMADFDGNETAVRSNIITQVNTASQVYESTFNISLGIQNLTVSPQACPSTSNSEAPWNIGCSDSLTITDRLNLFSQWRGQHNDTNAYWTLMSTCGTDSAVGLAWLGQLCMKGSETSSSSGTNETVAAANVVVRTSTEWQVFAHESGHTFGAVHDCTSTTCADGTATKQQCCPLSSTTCNADGQYIMNPSTGTGITQFSPCSVGNICSAMGRQSVQSTCLTNNKNVVTITGSQCGNGIVESGEDCDCGGTEGCGDNSCCDATTCKFTSGSVCDPSNEECCTQQCSYASNSTVCRSSTGVCDPEETCTGSSASCPADHNAADGTSCGSGLQCASGQCTSRDQQCQSLMGSLTTNNDTEACDSSSCQISCKSPQFGSNVCYTMSQNFLDGTSCESGGKCNNGNCQGANVGDEIKSWITDNKNIVIPVACVVGAFVILAIACCIWTACRRGRRRARGPPRGPKPPPPGWGSVPPPMPPAARSRPSRMDRPDSGFPQDVPPPPYTDGGRQNYRK